jgi:plasmid stability protein
VDAAGTELRGVRLELPIEVHKLLRMEAARREMSMAAAARAIIEEALTKKKPGAK